jgi:genome maintenance exonuclease 1
MFNHVDLNLEHSKLITENVNGKRMYVTPEGNKYPSVTTVLGWFSAKGIKQWRERVGAETANKITTQAARRGTAVHHLCEDYLNNVDIDFKKLLPTDMELFRILKPVLDESVDDIHLQEQSMYSDHLELAGTVDCVAKFNGKLSVIDFKTSRQTMKGDKYGKLEKYFRQASAYAVMFEERYKIPINNLVIIAAVDGSDEPEVYTSKRDKHIMQMRDMVTEYMENAK